MNKKNIDTRLQELGIYGNYYYRLELKPLAQILNIDESLNSIITGIVDGRRRLIAVTSYRIIIIASGAVVGGEVIIIRRSNIKSWKFNRKFLLSSVELETSERTITVKQTQSSQEKLFTWAMNQPIQVFDE